MTKEEAIAYGKDYYRDLIVACCEIDEKHKEFVRMSLEALNREPCDDAISRQAVLDCLTATKLKKFDFILYAREEIKKLPSVNPQQRVGHCKDCRYYRSGSLHFPGHCDWHGGLEPDEDWFCADYEQKEQKMVDKEVQE